MGVFADFLLPYWWILHSILNLFDFVNTQTVQEASANSLHINNALCPECISSNIQFLGTLGLQSYLRQPWIVNNSNFLLWNVLHVYIWKHTWLAPTFTNLVINHFKSIAFCVGSAWCHWKSSLSSCNTQCAYVLCSHCQHQNQHSW